MVQTGDHAMTEVALALAMAFFAIFILAAVSMSQSSLEKFNANTDTTKNNEVAVHDLSLNSDTAPDRTLRKDDLFYVYFKGEFYDADLKLVNLQVNTKQVVVGVLPSLSMGEMINLKNEKNMPNLVITLLNDQWQQRLELMK